jgi:hypothetical protein
MGGRKKHGWNMNDKFGQFEWHCWKDRKPIENQYIYFYDSCDGIGEISVGCANEYSSDDDCYWCYVFIPNPPKIEKKLSLEERVGIIETQIKALGMVCRGMDNASAIRFI